MNKALASLPSSAEAPQGRELTVHEEMGYISPPQDSHESMSQALSGVSTAVLASPDGSVSHRYEPGWRHPNTDETLDAKIGLRDVRETLALVDYVAEARQSQQTTADRVKSTIVATRDQLRMTPTEKAMEDGWRQARAAAADAHRNYALERDKGHGSTLSIRR